MTHSLHRLGKPQELKEDWVVICISAAGINNVGAGVKIKRFLELCAENNASSMGSNLSSEYLEESREKFINLHCDDNTMAGQVTFSNEKDVANLLKQLKKEDLGISVVVSGLIDEVDHICKCTGNHHHTVTNSLGIWGRTDLLPPPEILAITTMCGHGMISANHVYFLLDRIKKGLITPEKASLDMAKDCVCGIFNPVRCTKLLKAMIEVDAED